MRKKIVAALLLCVVLVGLAGCGKGELGTLDKVPENAVLVFTRQTGYEDGIGISFNGLQVEQEGPGYFVVEVQHTDGAIKKLQLKTTDGDKVASFGDIERDALLVGGLVTEGAGSYELFCGRLKEFGGTLNLYFVPGVDYD